MTGILREGLMSLMGIISLFPGVGLSAATGAGSLHSTIIRERPVYGPPPSGEPST